MIDFYGQNVLFFTNRSGAIFVNPLKYVEVGT